MSSASGEPIGEQKPRIDVRPKHKHTTGPEAIELAASAGLFLDEWQQDLLTSWLGETEDGKWAAATVGLMVSRQNGKGALLEARELAGLFLLEEPVIVHTAHLQDTATVHFRRLVDRIKKTPALEARLAKPGGILRGHGTECIRLAPNPVTGVAPELQVRTRTGSGGLGFSINCLVFDEAMIISDAMHQALLPTLSAQSMSGELQMIYTGSAPDEENPSHQAVPFARVRESGLRGDPGMMYSEWSLDVDDPARIILEDVTSEDLRVTNPGLGVRISEDYIRQAEMPALGGRGSAVQRLGVGAWPRTDGLDDVMITPEMWDPCRDDSSEIVSGLCFALDAAPGRGWWSVCAAGKRADGLFHVEMMQRRKSPGWVIDYLVEQVENHKPLALLVDGLSGAFSMLPEITEALKEKHLLGTLHEQQVTILSSREHAQACGMLYDAVAQQTVRHIGQPELADATRGAGQRNLTDAWAWSRINSSADISPLVGCTLALWGAITIPRSDPQVINMNDFV